MTAAARIVLQDCRIALSLLEDDEDDDRWRIHWAAAVALIRAVGHVLHKVDGRRSPQLASAIRTAYKKWRSGDEEHEIFVEFIERERNNLLKEYHTDVHPLTETPIAYQVPVVPMSGGEPLLLQGVFTLDKNIYRPMLDGVFEGNDARDVLEIAIKWWEKELTKIDEEAHATRFSD